MKYRLVTAIAVLSLVSFGMAAHAQPGFGIPQSNTVVVGEFTYLPAGSGRAEASQGSSSQVVTFAVREGTLLTISDARSGQTIGLSPAVGEGQIEWLLLKIEGDPSQQSLSQIGTPLVSALRGRDRSVAIPVEGLDIALEVHNIIDWNRFPTPAPATQLPAEQPNQLQQVYGVMSGNSCCGSCRGLTVCGNSVRISSCAICQDIAQIPLPLSTQ